MRASLLARMTFTIASVNVNGIRAACKQRNENNPGMNVWLEETTDDVVQCCPKAWPWISVRKPPGSP